MLCFACPRARAWRAAEMGRAVTRRGPQRASPWLSRGATAWARGARRPFLLTPLPLGSCRHPLALPLNIPPSTCPPSPRRKFAPAPPPSLPPAPRDPLQPFPAPGPQGPPVCAAHHNPLKTPPPPAPPPPPPPQGPPVCGHGGGRPGAVQLCEGRQDQARGAAGAAEAGGRKDLRSAGARRDPRGLEHRGFGRRGLERGAGAAAQRALSDPSTGPRLPLIPLRTRPDPPTAGPPHRRPPNRWPPTAPQVETLQEGWEQDAAPDMSAPEATWAQPDPFANDIPQTGRAAALSAALAGATNVGGGGVGGGASGGGSVLDEAAEFVAMQQGKGGAAAGTAGAADRAKVRWLLGPRLPRRAPRGPLRRGGAAQGNVAATCRA